MAIADLQRDLDKIKIALMDDPDSIFYTSVFFSLNHVWTDQYPTAATDGRSVFFNPEFFARQSMEKKKGLVLHETEHVGLLHMEREGDRDHEKANRAADYVINIGLRDRGIQLPDDGLYDPAYRGMCFEEVYDIIPDEPPEGYSGDLIFSDDPELKEHINDILIRAAMQVHAAGANPDQIPGHVRVHLDKLLHPKLPWHRILSRQLSRIVKSGYSFSKPNRRFFPDMLLPSMHTPGLGHVGVALDMSGSVTDKQSTCFATEVSAMLRRAKPKEISLVQFDTKIQSINSLTCTSDLNKVTFHGRGGTNIKCVIDWAIKAKPEVLIIFTDGQFDHYPVKPELPVIWVILNNFSWIAPYGRVIHFSE